MRPLPHPGKHDKESGFDYSSVMHHGTPGYQDAIDEIVSWVTTSYVDARGGLPRGISKDGAHSAERLFNDLGDYLPFFATLNQREFCASQIAAARTYRRSDRLLPAEFRYAGLPCIRAYDHSDYLLGLIEAARLLNDGAARQDAVAAAERVWEVFFSRGMPRSWYVPSLRRSLPLTDFRDGMYVELFLELGSLTDDARWIARARSLADALRGWVRAADYPLVPEVAGHGITGRAIVAARLREASRRYRPIKYVANTLFGLLELHRFRPDDALRSELAEARGRIAADLCTPEGAPCVAVRTPNGMRREPPTLVDAFPIIDWCCDAAHALKDDTYLGLARGAADFWLLRQHPATGLIPLRPDGTDTDIDTLTDTSIALWKLAELTGVDAYAAAARRIVDGVVAHHRDPETAGYAHAADVRTGAKTNRGYKVKYVCLFLKALLVAKNAGNVYSTPELALLVKDR